MKITNVKIEQLNPSEYNPRSWDQSAISNLTESIKRYGIVDPIIVNGAENRKNIVIGGHFRLKIAEDLGFTEIPVVYLDIPNIEKEKELNLRLNQNTGAWDYELLKNFDVDMLLDIGFDDTVLSHIWDEQLGVGDDEFNVEEELEQINDPQSRLGQVYKLGRHYLLCGDATDSSAIQTFLDSVQVDMIYCDPPYNISLDYNKGIGNKKTYGGSINDNKADQEYKDFISTTLQNGLSVANENTHVFYWCDERYIGLIQEIYQEVGVDSGNRTIDDIQDLFNIWLAKRIPTQDYEHPTEKPPTLHEKPLKRCTKPGSVVLDLFGGSGSTLVACEQLNRTCYMVEVEPIFCDLIINRYEKLTREEAVLCT